MVNRLFLKLIFSGMVLLGTEYFAVSQNAPVTTCSTVSGALPGNVSVPLTVTGFTSIGAISLSIDYNYTVMQFVQGVPNSSLAGFLSGDSDLGNGFHRITMGWFGSGSSLPDGSTIMTLIFNYVGGNTPLTWFENGSSCEYADAMGTVLNDSPPENYYLNGYVCGAIGNPGAISGNNTVCQGQSGEMYSVEPLENVIGYLWTLPSGADIVSGDSSNVIIVDFSGQALSGLISVYGFNECGSGPASSMEITVNTIPLADAGADQVINYGTTTTLQAAAGGPGTYAYHWSPEELLVNPDVQNPVTVIMTATTIFTLTVTNLEGLCLSYDDVVVTIVGGPLGVNPMVIPGSICQGESAQLYANAGGGSGNYTYQWTCIPADDPPWTSTLPNPVVSPDSSKHYLLNVFDGFTEVNGNIGLTVFQLPTSNITGDTTLCGPGNMATLNIDLTGIPPWSFNVTNGITTTIFNDINTTPFSFLTNEAGFYTVIDLEDVHCSGISSGTATVNIFPVPDKPEISILDYNLISSSCCGNQWYLDNEPIPGATAQVYSATESGQYFVIVTLNGCTSDTSDIVDLVVGIDEKRSGIVMLYPNPAKEYTRIYSSLPLEERIRLKISALDGRLIQELELLTGSNQKEILIETHHLLPGVYFITIYYGNKYKQGKLVIR